MNVETESGKMILKAKKHLAKSHAIGTDQYSYWPAIVNTLIDILIRKEQKNPSVCELRESLSPVICENPAKM